MVFMTLKELFEPTVMSFEITHSLVIFQIIMNKILWNLINIGEVTSFINNIIVGMEEEEGYDEVVEEVVKRLVENDFYVKLEKYKQKVRKVDFLRVVIGPGPEGIKIEKKKVKGVLNWLTPKEVKDIQKFLGLVNYYWQFIKDFISIARLLDNLVKKIRSEIGWKDKKRYSRS